MSKDPIGEIIARRLPVTLQLTLYAFAISVVVAVPLGVIAAIKQDRWPDYLARMATITGLALPHFWVALLLILGLVVFFHWSPPVVYVNAWQDPWTHIQIAIWPALVLAWGYSSYIARVTRSSMLDRAPAGLRADGVQQGVGPECRPVAPRAPERTDPRGHHRGGVFGEHAGRHRHSGKHLRHAGHRPGRCSGRASPGLPGHSELGHAARPDRARPQPSSRPHVRGDRPRFSYD